MPSEAQPRIQRLLLLAFDSLEAIASLNPSLNLLQSLPDLDCTLLTPHSTEQSMVQVGQRRAFQHRQMQLEENWNESSIGSSDWLQKFSVDLIQKMGESSEKVTGSPGSKCAFDAAIIFTAPHQSPYVFGYLCYLAGIPLRYGQSREFGGAVLTTCIVPPIDPVPLENYHLHLVQSVHSLMTESIPLVAI